MHRVSKSDHEDVDIFVQDNFYYLCDVEPVAVQQNLDDYEREERYTLEWVLPNEAIEVNRLRSHAAQSRTMIEREALVLEMLMQEGLLDWNPENK